MDLSFLDPKAKALNYVASNKSNHQSSWGFFADVYGSCKNLST